MEELQEAREQDLKYDYDLLNQLELLRIHYSTTAKEAGKVIVAYGNYEAVLKNGVQLLEKSDSLLSIPMPALPNVRHPSTSFNNSAQADITSIDTVDMDIGSSDEEREPELPRAFSAVIFTRISLYNSVNINPLMKTNKVNCFWNIMKIKRYLIFLVQDPHANRR